MNAKKFKFELKNKIESQTLTNHWIKKLYQNDKISYLNQKSVSDLIKEHYQEIITNCDAMERLIIVRELSSKKEMHPFLEENDMELFKRATSLAEINDILKFPIQLDHQTIMNQNLKKYLKEVPHFCFFSILILTDNYFTKENQEILNHLLFENQKEYLAFYLFYKTNLPKEMDNLLELITKLVKEIKEHEKIKDIDIKKIKGGAYSEVLKIGTKVLKIGKSRTTYQIPYDKRILQPIIRVDLSKLSSLSFTLEVSEYINPNVQLTEEEEYQFYKELRERGIIFADMKSSNLGILSKENIIHWRPATNLDLITKGITNEPINPPLSKGELVILDTDYLYTEKDYNHLIETEQFNWGNEQSKMYEYKYQAEKKQPSRK